MKKPTFPTCAAVVAILGIAVAAAQAAGPAKERFGKKNPFHADELPEGELKNGLRLLDPQAKDKAMKWLHTFDFHESDATSHLRVDKGGGIFIVCPDSEGTCDGHCHAHSISAEHQPISDEPVNNAPAIEESSGSPPVGYASVSVSSPPAYHSKPNATRRIYLDFNGGIVSGTAWNSSRGVNSWEVKAWSQDSDATAFNDAEQAWMKRVWQRVAEDYAPFDIDVTTDTAYDPDNYTGNKDLVGWLMICETTDKNGVALPHNGSGGVAYIGVFGTSTYSPTYQPAWVTSTNGGGSESVIAEAASHEMGHNMGLSHDATPTSSYYGGHGSGDISWGPIMGTGYSRNVSQWCKGEYYDANLFEDDLSIISSRVPYRADDHANTPGTATQLTITGGTTISSTTPENDPANSNPANKGVIELNTDVDVFSFYTGAGSVQLNADPWIQPADTRGGNLDILLELYNDAGTLVASDNGATRTHASISVPLTQGYYFLHVRNSGTGNPLASSPTGYTSYGSIGQYFISGTIVGGSPPPVLTGISPTSGFANSTVTIDVSGTGLGAATTVRLTKSGQSDISASSVALVGQTLRCQFNLNDSATGAWDVVATNPNLESSTLPNAYTVIGAVWAESFDGPVSGWTSEATTGANAWTLTAVQSHSPQQSYFAPAPSLKTTTNLVSPSIAIPAGATNLQFKFWHQRSLQSTRDAGKLEFSVNGGAWFDAGSSGSGTDFASNGYNSVVNSSGSQASRNEFAGQSAWSGNSGGFVETIVNFTDNTKFAGKLLRARWRIATNASTASSGWHVDSVSLTGDGDLSNHPPVIATAASSSSTESVTDPDTTVYQIVRGNSVNLFVSATDDAGESSLSYTWSLLNGPGAPVVFSANDSNSAKDTTATFAAPGDYQISVSVRDAQGLSASGTLNLRVLQNASGIVVTPGVVSLDFGGTQLFSATLLDQFSASMANQPLSFTWSASGGGTINTSGLFSANAAGGPHLVTATSGAISGTASVTVHPAPASVSITNLLQPYTGSSRSVTVTTNPSGLSIAVTYDGSATPPTAVGSYAVHASVTDPNYQGESSATLVIEAANDFDNWVESRFNEAQQLAGEAAESADPEGDGLTNLAEYALGTHPYEFTPMPTATLDANGLAVIFTRPSGLADVIYAAESSDGMGVWTPVPLELIAPGATETVRARDPLTGGQPPKKFIRLKFSR
jgi:MBG domain/Metallo-peptidase family M12